MSIPKEHYGGFKFCIATQKNSKDKLYQYHCARIVNQYNTPLGREEIVFEISHVNLRINKEIKSICSALNSKKLSPEKNSIEKFLNLLIDVNNTLH